MMISLDANNEYAIHVPGRGYVMSVGPTIITLVDDLIIFPDLDDAIATMKRAKMQYVTMRCPEIAESIRILTRTVTVTRGDWTETSSDATDKEVTT
jgi:hypothetical protein